MVNGATNGFVFVLVDFRFVFIFFESQVYGGNALVSCTKILKCPEYPMTTMKWTNAGVPKVDVSFNKFPQGGKNLICTRSPLEIFKNFFS